MVFFLVYPALGIMTKFLDVIAGVPSTFLKNVLLNCPALDLTTKFLNIIVNVPNPFPNDLLLLSRFAESLPEIVFDRFRECPGLFD